MLTKYNDQKEKSWALGLITQRQYPIELLPPIPYTRFYHISARRISRNRVLTQWIFSSAF